MKTPRITFRKQKVYDGKMHLPRRYAANLNGLEIATIQECHRDLTGDAWFWYGDGVNTAGTKRTLEQCKAEIHEHFKNNPVPL